LHLAEKCANNLERKLKASEKARKKAEVDAAGIEDLQERLHATKKSLSDKEAALTKREAAMIARLETQSARFSSNVTISLLYPF
jgi:thioesterase domain-containing protein